MRRNVLVLVALAGMLVLAGCSGGTPSAEQVDAEQIKSDTLAAFDAVETYRVSSDTTIVQSFNEQQQRQTIEMEVWVDRPDQRIHTEETISVGAQSRETSLYFRDGTIYQHNPDFTAEYGSEWVTIEADPGFFTQQDRLARQRAFFDNATVSMDGTERVNGTETSVLAADVDEEATSEAIKARLGGANDNFEYDVSNIDQRVWVDTETNQPIKTTTQMNATVTAQGQSVSLQLDSEMSFDYEEDVTVTLPKDADSAVSIGNQTSM